ncbi:MAG: hypothetical protein JRS35_11025 [Deltaproteobacteria bacterium]|nr:hypothetical protein [Deltaproteobacteria bacterium]
MRVWVMTGLLALALPIAAGARMRCPDWQALGPDEKVASVEAMIEGHLSSNKSKRFTSENRVAMRRCLEANIGLIVDDIDGQCSSGKRSADPVDDVFDSYLLSCVN